MLAPAILLSPVADDWNDFGHKTCFNFKVFATASEIVLTSQSLNMSLRKVTKTRSSFPNDEAVLKLLYLALRNISKKWTMPIQNWKAALNRFAIIYEERMPTD